MWGMEGWEGGRMEGMEWMGSDVGQRAVARSDSVGMKVRERFGEDTHRIIGACIEVHRHLGPGLLESAYEECVAHELKLRGMTLIRQPVLPLVYKGLRIPRAYQPDFLIEGGLVLEIKAVQALLPVHAAQLRTYMKLQRREVGLLG